MIERPNADALMAGPLGQWLSGQQAARDEAKAKSKRYTFYGIVAALGLGVFVLILFQDIEATLWVAAAAFGIGAYMAHEARKAVTDVIKGEINGAIARALDLEYANAVTEQRCFEAACQFQLLPDHDNDHLEDQWSGTLGDQPFVLHECRLTEERGSGKSRRTVTVFQGSLMSIGFNRDFIGTTLIERERNRRKWYGALKEEIEMSGIALQRVDMVDPRFEDAFAIWSSDGVEARYLVHPEYVERLIAVEQAYSGQNIRALFHGGVLLIALESGNMFESGSLDAGDDRGLLEHTIDQFGALADLATKLNERPRAGFN